jgi:arylsulfatase A-like enzyme
MRRPPNILLLMADQWRADCLGFAGHPVVETPHLDELFCDGVHFRQAYSSCPTCIPARAALLTGLGQASHGRTRYADGVAWDYPATLPGLLAQAGYHTQCIGKMHVHPARSLQGFHHVVLHDGSLGIHRRAPLDYDYADDYRRWLREHTHGRADLRDTGLGVNSWVVAPWPHAEHLHPTNWVASECVDFLRRRDPTKPFFLKASFVRPHPPFDPPEHYLRRYEQKPLPPVAMGDWVPHRENDRRGLRASFGRGRVDPAQADRARRAYYALITHVDAQINRILLELKDQGLDDNTLILFVSDHGELLGDHELWAKAMPFDGSARVPFILRPPPAWGLRGGRVCDDLVELRDVLPTFCEAAGAPVPASVEGRSVLPQIRGERAPGWRADLHGEHEFGDESNHWLTDGAEKYVWFSARGEELLFDLRADPREEKNLAAVRPERVAFWRNRLIDELAARGAEHVREARLPSSAALAGRAQGLR